MKVSKINRSDILNLLKDNRSEIFSVVFLKKNGELRPMTCRFGVKKHLKGGNLAFNPLERNLLVVFDMQKEGYRMINLETLMLITMKGVQYHVTD